MPAHFEMLRQATMWAFRRFPLVGVPWFLAGIYFANAHGGPGGVSFLIGLVTVWPLLLTAEAVGDFNATAWIAGGAATALWLYAVLLLSRLVFLGLRGKRS